MASRPPNMRKSSAKWQSWSDTAHKRIMSTPKEKQFKFRAFGYPEIERVEIERETASSVWVRGRQCRKRSDYHCYFDTAKEAAEAIITRQEERVALATKRLESAKKDIETAMKMLARRKAELLPIIEGTATAPDEMKFPRRIII